jgi:hypothetical protein
LSRSFGYPFQIVFLYVKINEFRDASRMPTSIA